MITPEEMARLRVRLDELPGIDHQGLWIEHPSFMGGRAIATQPDSAPYQDCTVDLSDSATRDWVARWVAVKRGLFTLGSTAPAWAPVVIRGGHTEMLGWSLHEPSTGSDHYFDGTIYAPGLDPEDGRLLPDGSRWVDAAALAAVARQVGYVAAKGA